MSESTDADTLKKLAAMVGAMGELNEMIKNDELDEGALAKKLGFSQGEHAEHPALEAASKPIKEIQEIAKSHDGMTGMIFLANCSGEDGGVQTTRCMFLSEDAKGYLDTIDSIETEGAFNIASLAISMMIAYTAVADAPNMVKHSGDLCEMIASPMAMLVMMRQLHDLTQKAEELREKLGIKLPEDGD